MVRATLDQKMNYSMRKRGRQMLVRSQHCEGETEGCGARICRPGAGVLRRENYIDFGARKKNTRLNVHA